MPPMSWSPSWLGDRPLEGLGSAPHTRRFWGRPQFCRKPRGTSSCGIPILTRYWSQDCGVAVPGLSSFPTQIPQFGQTSSRG